MLENTIGAIEMLENTIGAIKALENTIRDNHNVREHHRPMVFSNILIAPMVFSNVLIVPYGVL
jgi:hypothetical protein